MAHGRYTIVGKIADGGMAEIFLATLRGAEGFEKPVVLKRVLTAFSADPQFRNMFLDEAHISMTLAHSNIVQVLDVGLSNGRTFLVLELVEGWDLEDLLSRAQATGADHPWPPSLGLYVTAQICRGLAYAHGKRATDGRPLGIVHRDVNPTNVLISEQGEVKLADFGIAKAERKREQTAAGVIKGKIGFMSPEQATGQGLDARSDLFSVGTMLYLMLTGQRPFDAPSELESMMKSQRAEYRPPEELNPYLPAEATSIVNRAMRRDPAARYQSADEMLVDVERALRTHYNSAGQTELKLWMSELARRDGALPMGRRLRNPAGTPVPGEVTTSDLSAGVSVELSDVGLGDAGPTLVQEARPFDLDPGSAPRVPALPPPSTTPAPVGAGVIGGRTPRPVPAGPGGVPGLPGMAARPGMGGIPSPRQGTGSGGTPSPARVPSSIAPSPALAPSASSPSLSPLGTGGELGGRTPSPAGSVSATGLAPPAAGTPAPLSGSRSSPLLLPPLGSGDDPRAAKLLRNKKSRAGFGFILGAACMLGAVFGIRWLAAWAGREGVVIPHVIDRRADASIDGVAAAPPATAASPGTPPRDEARSGPSSPGEPSVAAPQAVAQALGAAGARGSSGAEGSAAAVSGPAVDAAAPVARGDHDAGTATAPSAPSAGAERPPDVPQGKAPAPVEDEEEDEETLLGRVIPDAGTVIGEDEADPSPGPPSPARAEARSTGSPAAGQTPSSNPPPARRPAAPAPTRPPAQPVLVRITSSPLGAVVRTKKQVLGRTPIAIRFNPGNTYRLTFVKKGYVTSNRMVPVASGKPQSISVPMKKAAAPPRRISIFRGR